MKGTRMPLSVGLSMSTCLMLSVELLLGAWLLGEGSLVEVVLLLSSGPLLGVGL